MELTEYLIILLGLLKIFVSKTQVPKYLEKCHNEFYSCSMGHKRLCQCDSLCRYYDDCCFDAGRPTKDLSDNLAKELMFLDKTICEAISYGEHVPTGLYNGVFMISSCPEGRFGDEITLKCESNFSKNNILDSVPVSDILTNNTFKNRHCAKCNHVQNWDPWYIEMHCGIKSFLYKGFHTNASLLASIRLGIKDCSYRFIPPISVKARSCFNQFDYNPRKNLSLYNTTICDNRVIKPVIANYTVYRSLQCFLENGHHNQSLVFRTMCFLGENKFSSLNLDIITSTIDISVLLNRGSNIKCDETETYISNQVKCQYLYCPINTEPYRGGCRNFIKSSAGVILDLLFVVTPRRIPYESEILYHHMLFDFLYVLRSCRENLMSPWSGEMAADVYHGKYTSSQENCLMVRMRYPLKKTTTRDCSLEYEKWLLRNYALKYRKEVIPGVIVHHISDVTKSTCQTNVSFSNPVYIMDQYWGGTLLPCPAVKVDLIQNSSDEHAVNITTSFDLNGIKIHASDVINYSDGHFLCIETYRNKYELERPTINFSPIVFTVFNAGFAVGLLVCLAKYYVETSFRKVRKVTYGVMLSWKNEGTIDVSTMSLFKIMAGFGQGKLRQVRKRPSSSHSHRS